MKPSPMMIDRVIRELRWAKEMWFIASEGGSSYEARLEKDWLDLKMDQALTLLCDTSLNADDHMRLYQVVKGIFE